MKRVIVLLAFLVTAIVIVSCQKESEVSPEKTLLSQKKQNKERVARSGPGYSWQFSTPNQNSPGESYTPPGSDPYFFLKQSAGYTRQLTLTITKTSASSENPVFRVYKRNGGCFSLGTPTVSMGTTAPTTFVHDQFDPNAQQFTGTQWTVPLGASAVGTTATFTFTVSAPGSSCVEGYVNADMVTPSNINSAFNYWDGDHMYLVKSSN